MSPEPRLHLAEVRPPTYDAGMTAPPKSGVSAGSGIRLLYLFLAVTYIVILIVPIATGAATQRRTETLLRSEIIAANQGILRQLKITIEGELESLSRKTVQISETPRIRSIRAAIRVDPRPPQYDVYEASNLLRSAVYTSRLVRRSFLYFTAADYIISDGFASDRLHFFDLESGAQSMSIEEWEHLLGGEHEGSLISISDRDLYYAESPVGSTGRDRDVTVCYILEKERVRELITSSGWIAGSSLFVVDRQGRMVVSRAEGVHDLPLDVGAVSGSPGVIEHPASGNVIIHEPSEKHHLEYVLVLPRLTVLAKLNHIRRYASYSLLATIVLGLLGGLFFARLQYTPVRNLFQVAVRSGAHQGYVRSRNAYDVIQTALTSACDSEARYRELSDRRLEELRRTFLYRMLGSLEMDDEARAEGLRTHGVVFRYDSFGIILAIIESETVESIESVEMASPEPLELGPGLEGMEILILKPSHVFIILANFDGARHDVRSVAAQLRKELARRLGSSVTLAVSSQKTSVHALPQAYHEAVQALEYRDVLGPGEVIDYVGIRPSRVLFTYSVDDEVRLINLVRAGDSTRAVEVVEGILDSSRGWDRMTEERRTLLKYNLIGTFARLIGDGSDPQRGGVITDASLTDILTCESLPDLRTLVLRITRDLCVRYEPADGTARHRDLVAKIREFVAASYADPDLNIASLGDVFRLTPYYISQIFRELQGTSLLEYINRYRVEQAKPLLLKPDMSVGQIARKVGYQRLNAFIRIFKNLEGVTPGAYRESRKA